LPVTARNIAAEVVARVERDGAFAAAVLDHELKRAVQLNTRDRALATELVYGTLRLRTLLEKAVESVTPRGIQALDSRTRALLLVAAYQLCYTRVPAFAAVSEAVEAIRSIKGRTIGGFANGALRQLALVAEKTPLPPLPVAFRDATAPWLRRALERSIGEDATEALLTAGPYPPPLNLRVRPKNGAAIGALRDEWVHKLGAALPNAKIEAAPFAPGAIRVRGAGDPHALPGYDEGAWTIQEEGSQLVAHLLGARPGEHVLDACAGRGNKSTLLAEQLAARDGASAGRLDVADVKPEKLGRLAHEFERLGLQPPHTFGVDWAKGHGDVEERAYDRVLVDAPCSGTGTIRRRPEIQTRRQAADLPEIADVQAKMLVNAVDVVRPGGRIVYAVCSVLRDEAESVVAKVRQMRADVEPAPFDAPIAESLFGAGATQGRLMTHVHGTDAYFVACLKRTG
jgi:16S rRNA (cytosine967-C5)-methyltransferase